MISYLWTFAIIIFSRDSYVTLAIMKFSYTYFVRQEMNIFVWNMFWHPEISDMILVEPPSFPPEDGVG